MSGNTVFLDGAAIECSMDGGKTFFDISEISMEPSEDIQRIPDTDFKSINFENINIEGSFTLETDTDELKKFIKYLRKIPRKKKKAVYGTLKSRKKIINCMRDGRRFNLKDLRRAKMSLNLGGTIIE